MLFYSVLIVIELLLSDRQLDLASSHADSSFKDQLSLECQHHPSSIVRLLLKSLLGSLERGISLGTIFSKLGFSTHQLELDWHDLQQLLKKMATQHPEPYPLMHALRFIGLAGLTHIFIAPNNTNVLQVSMLGLSFIFIASFIEYSLWLRFKAISINLLLLKKDPLSFCYLRDRRPTPSFLKSRSLIKLWQHCFTIRPDLKKTIDLFHDYYAYSQLRLAKRWRRQLALLIDGYTYNSHGINLLFFLNQDES